MTHPKSKRARRQPRWGTRRNAAPDEAQQRILDAARACYQRQGVAQTSMADVAAEAGIGRATLYRRFATREALMLGLLRQQVEAFLEAFRVAHPPGADFCGWLRDFMVFSITQSAATPMHHDFFAEDSALWVCRNYLNDPASRELTQALFRPAFEQARVRGEIHADLRLEDIFAWYGRMMIAYMLAPPDPLPDVATLETQIEALGLRALRAPDRRARTARGASKRAPGRK